MNRFIAFCLSSLTLIPGDAPACGPFFPDTMLDKPQAALDVPPVSFLHGLYELSGIEPHDDTDDPRWSPHPMLAQIPIECRELGHHWKHEGVAADVIEQRLQHYRQVREALLKPVTHAGMMEFITDENQPIDLPERPLGDEFPQDVADYVEAARLHATGQTKQARELWQRILAMPPKKRRLRGAWAAWMLAKTSSSTDECIDHYEMVEKEIAAGASDALLLGPAAKAWRAGQIEDKPDVALRLFHDAFVGGQHYAVTDIRRLAEDILASEDENLLRTAATDPVLRGIVNLHMHACLDGPTQSSILEQPSGQENGLPGASWLAALEQHADFPLVDGARVAWALYTNGQFEDAKRWLNLSVQSSPTAMWLQAKFLLRDGRIEAAHQMLTKAASMMQAADDWNPINSSSDLLADGGMQRQQAAQGRLMADTGVLSIARKQYGDALERMWTAGYHRDAAYVAERLMTTDELLAQVRKLAPEWESVVDAHDTINPSTCLTHRRSLQAEITNNDNLRYLCARRLAREECFREAREFMHPNLLPLLDHYVALDQARRSGKKGDPAHAAIVWRQAMIHRHYGAELFSTEGFPDGAIWWWSFPVENLFDYRRHQDGWSEGWGDDTITDSSAPDRIAIPGITNDEVSRAGRPASKPMERFHYRYRAADLAWQASLSLPDNHPDLVRLLNTAGQWLASRAPKTADRFYQAMVRRCPATAEGVEADRKRWFLSSLEPIGDLDALPERFK